MPEAGLGEEPVSAQQNLRLARPVNKSNPVAVVRAAGEPRLWLLLTTHTDVLVVPDDGADCPDTGTNRAPAPKSGGWLPQIGVDTDRIPSVL